jgi:transposase
MEATGVYYESLAYYLSAQGYQLSVVLPTRMKHYQKSLEIKSKTDSLDAKVLARLGLERTLQPWRVPSEAMLQIKMLSREYRENKQKLNVMKNQLHAKRKAHNVNAATIQRLKAQITLLDLQCHQIQKELEQLIAKDENLKNKIQKLETIPAVGFMTVITILAETNGFALISSQKQLICYAGMDIILNESGQIKRRSKMSKQGNKFIRHAVHMPALCAVQHNKDLKKFYQNLVERKKAKKSALTAVSRKLLCLIYTLWKKDECYQKQYNSSKTKKEEGLQEPLFTGCSLVENN